MYKPAKAGEDPVIWGVKEVCERYGIQQPMQLIDILGLMGDASDNIPGVPGVGEKTASKLIADYGSIDNILAHIHELKGKLRENIENNTASAIQSRQLATIITDAPVPFDAEALRVKQPDMEALGTLFDELEFRTFARRMKEDASRETRTQGTFDSGASANLFSDLEENTLPATSKATIHDTPHSYVMVSSEAEAKALVAELLGCSSVCFVHRNHRC